MFFAGCRKNDNPKVPDLANVPLPILTLAEDGETKIPGGDPASFSTSFTVDTYYKFGPKPKQFDVVVIKNGDKSSPKTVQGGITTFPTTVTVTGQQLMDLFGSGIALGDKFDVGVDVITQDGKKYDAFPVGGVTYAPGISNLPGINTILTFAAPCLFVPDEYTEGNYEVVFDEWNDYQPGDKVLVKKIDDTHYSFEYKVNNPQPIIMIVDPVDNSITVNPTMYGDYGPGFEFTATSVEGSEVDPCDLSFVVKLNHVYSGGDTGNYTIKLRKL